MDRISRRQVVRGAAAAAAMTLGAPSVHAQKGRQTLSFVAEADLKVLDPIWTTAYITRNHGYLVYDTLFGTDENYQIKPQMVDRTTVSPDGMKFTFTLREGLRWHDGQPVTSEDCVESLKRWGKKDRFGQLLMAHTGKIAPVDRLESIGFKVILKGMDWSTNLVARTRKEPPGKGGWNLLHTWWQAADVGNPAVHFGLSGAGPRAWFGWPDIPQLEKLVTDWVRATDQTKRKQLADEVQKVALSEVTYVPWGEWVQPTAFRKNVRGVLKFGAPIFWNVRVT
jgi:ABC-type transport system substrate-binding protein